MTIPQAGYLFPVLIAFGALYYETFSWIVSTWSTYRGSHGPIILAISIYMTWEKREEIRRLDLGPNFPWGAGLTVFGCFLLVSGRLGSLLLLQYISLVVTMLGVVLLLRGTGYLKALWFPIVYLVFMFPLFSEVLSWISVYLQTAAAIIANFIIGLCGVSSFRSGVMIELPQVSLEVARECNGINHIIALMSLAVPLAYWTHDSRAKKFVLITSAILIGVLANGIRVAIIGIASVIYPGGPVHGPYGLFYVSFIFFFGMLGLLGINKAIGGSRKVDEKGNGKNHQGDDSSGNKSFRIYPVVCSLFIFSVAAAYIFLLKPVPVYLAAQLTELPDIIQNWKGVDAAFTSPPFQYFQADEELKRTYKDGNGHEVELYIGYFPAQLNERKIVHYRFDPLQREALQTKINAGGYMINIKKTQNMEVTGGRVVYFWYDIGGDIYTDRYIAKIRTIYDALFHQRSNGTIVVVSTRETKDEQFVIEFLRNAFPVIQTYLRPKIS